MKFCRCLARQPGPALEIAPNGALRIAQGEVKHAARVRNRDEWQVPGLGLQNVFDVSRRSLQGQWHRLFCSVGTPTRCIMPCTCACNSCDRPPVEFNGSSRRMVMRPAPCMQPVARQRSHAQLIGCGSGFALAKATWRRRSDPGVHRAIGPRLRCTADARPAPPRSRAEILEPPRMMISLAANKPVVAVVVATGEIARVHQAATQGLCAVAAGSSQYRPS